MSRLTDEQIDALAKQFEYRIGVEKAFNCIAFARAIESAVLTSASEDLSRAGGKAVQRPAVDE